MHESIIDYPRWLQQYFKRVVVFSSDEAFGDLRSFNEKTGLLTKVVEERAEWVPAMARVLEVSAAWDKHICTQICKTFVRKIGDRKQELFGEEELDPVKNHKEYLKVLESKDWESDPDLFTARRNLFVIAAVSTGKFQLVAADPVVAVLWDEPETSKDLKPVRLVPGEIFRFEPTSDSKLFIYIPKDKKAAHKKVEMKIIRILSY